MSIVRRYCAAAERIWRLQQQEVDIEAVPQIGSATLGCGLPLSGSGLPRNSATAEGDEIAGEAGPANRPVIARISPG